MRVEQGEQMPVEAAPGSHTAPPPLSVIEYATPGRNYSSPVRLPDKLWLAVGTVVVSAFVGTTGLGVGRDNLLGGLASLGVLAGTAWYVVLRVVRRIRTRAVWKAGLLCSTAVALYGTLGVIGETDGYPLDVFDYNDAMDSLAWVLRGVAVFAAVEAFAWIDRRWFMPARPGEAAAPCPAPPRPK